MTHHIGDNQDENEKLFKCAECGRILDSGESCCASAPFWPEHEDEASRKFLEPKRKASHGSANT